MNKVLKVCFYTTQLLGKVDSWRHHLNLDPGLTELRSAWCLCKYKWLSHLHVNQPSQWDFLRTHNFCLLKTGKKKDWLHLLDRKMWWNLESSFPFCDIAVVSVVSISFQGYSFSALKFFAILKQKKDYRVKIKFKDVAVGKFCSEQPRRASMTQYVFRCYRTFWIQSLYLAWGPYGNRNYHSTNTQFYLI